MDKRAELQHLHFPELPEPESSSPPDPTDFALLVQALIGLQEEKGADTFSFVVVTPKWLARRVTADRPVLARGHLIVERYDYAQIRAEIVRCCELATGPDWPTVATILSRYARWEYEDSGRQA
jgi:hypothetical protein